MKKLLFILCILGIYNQTLAQPFYPGFSTYTPDGLFNATAAPIRFITPNGNGETRIGYLDYQGGQYSPRIGFWQNNAGMTAVNNSIGNIQNGSLTINVGANNEERIRVLPSGYVGIGVTEPSVPLQVNGIIRWGGLSQNYFYSGQDAGGGYIEQVGNSSAETRIRFQTAKPGDFSSYSQFYVDPNQGFSFHTTGSANGNVGIGTTTPGAKLHVLKQHSLNTLAPGTATSGVHIGGVSTSDHATGLTFGASGAAEGQAHAGIYVQSSGNYGTKMYFGTTDDYSVGTKTRMIIDYNGNVGLGTISPATKLQVNYQRAINISSIGTAAYGLHIGGVAAPDYANGITFGASGTAEGQAHAGIYVQSSGNYGTKMYFGTTDDYSAGSKTRMVINHAGDVGIGTTQPDAKLTVKGKIHAEEVKVDLSVPGPDYVFEKEYRLKSLEEVEKFVSENKHLPEIPSAKTMEKEGISMGEMQMKLLQKIEELTLYLIQKDKQIDVLQDGLKTQADELKKQKEEIIRINKKIN